MQELEIHAFHIIGNVYFVGTKEASSHLIVTEEGLILLDTGYVRTAAVVEKSMKKLGFSLQDIKIILHSHGHADHTDATAILAPKIPGVRTYLAKEDIKYITGWTPTDYYSDGMTVQLGSTKILCRHTPGHTEGAYSFFFDVVEDGVSYRAAMCGGAGPNQLRKDYMNRPDRMVSYRMRGKFFESMEKLAKEKVDVPLGNHVGHNDTLGKHARAKDASVNPYIDREGFRTFLLTQRERLLRIIEEEKKTHFVHYAHRGASEYCPENTLLSFYTGIYMRANGIETDVRKTKDGVLVLFHDDNMQRVCGDSRAVEDCTLGEIKELTCKKGELTDKIVTLEEFFRNFAHRDLTFAIELKGDCAKETVDMIRRFKVENKVTVTSFRYDYIKEAKNYAPEIRIGHLLGEPTDEAVEKLIAIGADEICPRGMYLTKQRVDELHRIGFNVRAWGVSNEEIMRELYDMGVDGYTVNFPDKSVAYAKGSQGSSDEIHLQK